MSVFGAGREGTMDFWQTLGSYLWQTETPWVMGMVVLLVLLVWRVLPEDRRVLGRTLLYYLLCFPGLFVAGLMHAVGLRGAAGTMFEVCALVTGIAVIRLWGLVLFGAVLPLVRLRPPRIVQDILITIAYVAWGMVRLRYAGMNLSGIVTTSAVITAVLAFSMQDTLGNILGGLALQLDKSVQVGDWVKIGDVSGRVTDIRWRSASVMTRGSETVVLPNSLLMKSELMVVGRRGAEPAPWRRWIWFNVLLDTPPTKVLDVVHAAIRGADMECVAKEPEPSCVLMDFDSGGFGRYALRYWLTDPAKDDPTDSLVRIHVLAALQRAGIRIAVPESRQYYVQEGAEYRSETRSREMARRLGALRRIDLFAKLHDDELRVVADGLTYSPFAAGEVMTRQGNVAHWLYIVSSGEAEVFLEVYGQERRSLAVLGEGSFFGEMGLMTGEPRSATVVARTDVECFRLDKGTFEQVLRSRPAIAEEITQILASRRGEQETARTDAAGRRESQVMAEGRSMLLGKIRSFFGLGPE
jgi:CRP-like cAMP-binding protein/small-conductance mechanosensitive channel